MTKKLTDIVIKTLPVPETGQRTYFEAHGFGVRVSQGGTRTFILVHGAKRRMTTLGRYPAVSLKDARKAAYTILGRGEAEQRQEGAILPLSQAVEAYLDHCEETNRARTVKDYRRHLTRLPKDLTRRTLSDLLTAITALELLTTCPPETVGLFLIHRYTCILRTFVYTSYIQVSNNIMTITRTSKATGEATTLTLDAAVDQFIRDNHAYGEIEESVEDYLDDMSTVFETQSMIEDMEGELDAGGFIYTKN